MGRFGPGSRCGYVGVGADKGKPALSRHTGVRSSRRERKRLGVGEPVFIYLRNNWMCPRNARTVLIFT